MKITKDRILFIIINLILVSIVSSISTYATSYLYNSNEVSYNNNESGISSDNVQGAIDTLYEQATNYNAFEDRLTSLENNKQNKITGAATTITGSNLTANRALISNGDGKVAVSGTTSTQLGYLNSVTSNVQTQLNNKMAVNPGNIEMMPGSSANHGGYIDFHYNNSSSDYTSRIIGYNGTMNLIASSGVQANGIKIKDVKTVDRTYSNLAINTKSASGAYYKCQETYTVSGYTFAGISVIQWNGAAASFVPYYQGNQVCFFSDVSETVSYINVRLIFIQN